MKYSFTILMLLLGSSSTVDGMHLKTKSHSHSHEHTHHKVYNESGKELFTDEAKEA